MWTREKLAKQLAEGATVDFLFFWGHTPKRAGSVDAACLSQWFERAFEIDGVRYATAEHFMMASKAKLFGDAEAFARVLRSASPADAKAIGRTVRGYDDDVWERARFDAVVRGNVAKFSQHEDLRRFLLGTRERRRSEPARHHLGHRPRRLEPGRARSGEVARPEPPRLRVDGSACDDPLMDSDLERAAQKFLDAFERVFHEDWRPPSTRIRTRRSCARASPSRSSMI